MLEQVHRIVDSIYNLYEVRKYCSAVFLDVSQAFDKVWHVRLLQKIKQNFLHNCFILLKSYLDEQYFLVKHDNATTKLNLIQTGIPQSSVFGSILYLIYTADIPIQNDVTMGTFTDDVAVLAVHLNLICFQNTSRQSK